MNQPQHCCCCPCKLEPVVLFHVRQRFPNGCWVQLGNTIDLSEALRHKDQGNAWISVSRGFRGPDGALYNEHRNRVEMLIY